MFGRDKLDNTLLTCDQGNLNQITTRSRNRTLVTVVKDTCTTTVPPAPPSYHLASEPEQLCSPVGDNQDL